MIKSKPSLFIFATIAFLLPLVYTTKNVLSGAMPFWYDPARDILLSLENLSKLTLIGPPAGIPGIFYGPYWIWLISGALLISKDPRIVTLITQTIPYFTLFPLLLFQFHKIFGMRNVIILWIFFIFMFNGYASQLWNPNLAPLLFLSIIYLVAFTDFFKKGKNVFIKTLFIGFITGITLNFHISFSIGLTLGICIFILLMMLLQIRETKSKWKHIIIRILVIYVSFFMGFLFSFLPTFAFEYRHDFQQTKVALKTITSPYAVVGQTGLTDSEILQEFFGVLSKIFYLSKPLMLLLGTGFVWYAIYYLQLKKFSIKEHDVRLLLLLVIISISVLFIYLTSKNPVWNYHFIGVEIIFLLILGFIAGRIKSISYGLTLFACFLLLLNLFSFSKSFSEDPKLIDTLASKTYITETIIQDAGNEQYEVFIYNPALYNYDYAYIFQAQGKHLSPDPSNTPLGAKLVYLIIPKNSHKELLSFINYRTPDKDYQTVHEWNMPDKTIVIKRVLIY